MEIKATTKTYGIFGHPVSQSLSPAMHNRAFGLLGLDCVYLAFNVLPRDLGRAVDSIRALSIAGVNVTVPHKQAVMGHLDEIAPEASMIGAVNTIVNDGGKLTGHNTDVSGVARALREELEFAPRGKRVFLVGAGGAARAVVAAMCSGGAARISLANRTHSNARALAGEFSARFGGIDFDTVALADTDGVAGLIGEADIVINSSSAGMEGSEPLGLPLDLLKGDSVVYDLVYKPAVTPLVKDARAIGLKAESGLGMLLYQGVEAFEIWTGEAAPAAAMREVLQDSR